MLVNFVPWSKILMCSSQQPTEKVPVLLLGASQLPVTHQSTPQLTDIKFIRHNVMHSFMKTLCFLVSKCVVLDGRPICFRRCEPLCSMLFVHKRRRGCLCNGFRIDSNLEDWFQGRCISTTMAATSLVQRSRSAFPAISSTRQHFSNRSSFRSSSLALRSQRLALGFTTALKQNSQHGDNELPSQELGPTKTKRTWPPFPIVNHKKSKEITEITAEKPTSTLAGNLILRVPAHLPMI